MANPEGRPSKLEDPDRRQDILDAARQGTSKAGCARAGRITPRTLHRWLDTAQECECDDCLHCRFYQDFKRARAKGEQELVERVKDRKPEYLLGRSYDYTETIEQDVQLSGDPDGAPVKVLGFDPAGYPTEEDDEDDASS